MYSVKIGSIFAAFFLNEFIHMLYSIHQYSLYSCDFVFLHAGFVNWYFTFDLT